MRAGRGEALFCEDFGYFIKSIKEIKEKLGVNRKDIDLIFIYLQQLEKAKHKEKTQKEKKQIGFKP